MKTAPVLHRTYPVVRTLRDYLLTLQAGDLLASLIEGVPSGHPKQLDELLDRALTCNSEGAPALPQAIDLTQSRSQQEVGTSLPHARVDDGWGSIGIMKDVHIPVYAKKIGTLHDRQLPCVWEACTLSMHKGLVFVLRA